MENEEIKVVKNNKGKTITIVVLILIILGLGGYIAYDKILSKTVTDKKESKEEVKEENKIEELEVNNKLITNLMTITEGIGIPVHMEINMYYKDKFLVDDLTIEEKLNLVFKDNNITSPKFDKNGEGINRELTKTKIDNSMNKLFGKIYPYTNKQVSEVASTVCNNAKYNKTKESYTLEPFGCGGTIGDDIGRWHFYHKVTSAYKYQDKIEIEAKVWLTILNYDGEDEEGNSIFYNKIYKANADKDKLENYLIKKLNTYEQEDDEFFDEADTYKYTFIKNGDNYSFSKVELVK